MTDTQAQLEVVLGLIQLYHEEVQELTDTLEHLLPTMAGCPDTACRISNLLHRYNSVSCSTVYAAFNELDRLTAEETD